MPAHTVGVSIPAGGRFGLTVGDYLSVATTLAFYCMPGIDHRAVHQWIIDHFFFGSIAFCSVFGTFFSHKLIEWGGMGFYTLLYWMEQLKSSASQRLHAAKINPTHPWAWDDSDVRVGEKYVALRWKSLVYIFRYHFVVSIVQFVIFTTAIHWSWSQGRFEWDWIQGHSELKRADPDTIPSKATVAYQCIVSTLVAETGFYFAHRLLHDTRLYYWHKRHHEYKDSTVYATFYVGLLDSILTDFIPAGFGIVYFEMHQWTIWMFTLPLLLNALRVHSGYDNSRLLRSLLGLPLKFDPSVTLPLCTDSERTHDLHHRYNNCNYGGAYFLWDRILGTWMDPDQEEKQKQKFAKAVAPANPATSSAADGKKKE